MKTVLTITFSSLLIGGCCMGGVGTQETIFYSKRSNLNKYMSLEDAETRCNLEANSGLEMWRSQCNNPGKDFDQIKANATPVAKRILWPLNNSQKRWYCADINKTREFNPDTYLDSTIKLPLMHIKSECMKELGFKENIKKEHFCRSSFFGPH